ncbi:MAG: acetyl/propionyl/methylcrotonyl-CoA carboxylase subunit alpha [Gammaproteobacteria bacterium]|nr:acetyl/propionyl/methylcrotonyl-CoA carboxylase subunit alpha [Gammaproteobacteria bacterium]
MFTKLLIANRGEIACRIAATAKRLGITTVAVYSDADRNSLAVDLADQAYRIGPAPAAHSYLDSSAILAAARTTGADAIHPGYGFLAENADFATACIHAGFTFVGPPAAAIRDMGNKHRAKQIMAKAGVPILPGYLGDEQEEAVLRGEAQRIGYPVMIKPTAGGGGKGMRLVTSDQEFLDALAAARREAQAFGDEHVLLERYLAQARHVEVQIFRDRYANAVHLFERDCSLQRRHQKILEEAPAPGLDEATRAGMSAAAIAAAHAIAYEGAGTVEFLLDADGEFYFMEMNTRLQVEHPVTEMISGEDLVEWQLKVAAGEALPRTQADLQHRGHALEARLYAENPSRGFLPSTGHLTHVRFAAGEGIRVDTGVRQDDTISPYYDPLIAKLVAWGENREAAVKRLELALKATLVTGVSTNLRFLEQLTGQSAVLNGEYDIRFVDRHGAELNGRLEPASPELVAVASCAVLLDREERARALAASCSDPHSPWHWTNGWRLNEPSRSVLEFLDHDAHIRVNTVRRGDGIEVFQNDRRVYVRAARVDDVELAVEIDGSQTTALVARDGRAIWALYRGQRARLSLLDPAARTQAGVSAHGEFIAPMPGRVVKLNVSDGEPVESGAALMVLEAMKMEHTICAPQAGTITRIHFQAGDLVDEGVELLDFEPVVEITP